MSAGGVLLLPRLLVVVWGLLLPHSLLLVQVSGGEVMTWYKTQVSKDKLQTQTPTDITSNRIIECAVMASQNPGTRHLFCHPDAATCSFYDLKVEAGHKDSAIGPVQDCWTRHPNESEASSVPFADLVAQGCVFLNPTLRTFDEARSFCQSEGGDMYVAGDFTGLQQYLGANTYSQVWVGGKNQVWLDGRSVTEDEWGTNDPDGGPNDCIRMREMNGDPHLMMDIGCDTGYPVMCQKGVAFP
ncbi:hypothetical protein Pcinc_026241 [Petrolisthes cinctipes]|uniref:C-type lectin domain-containing protein n=1 Tax=Petrolisthes cinctipes TaxID=88211 RepID=A0AAE1K8D4_PETCI|nr:hypothetical protein Pcinc_026241 [Petrolisthes cinctipes]